MNRWTLLLPILFAGCATVPPFPEPNAQWQNFSGQLQYVTAQRSVIGEFAGSRQADDFRLDFSKGGSVPLLRIARHGQFGRAEGALARGRWQGDVAHVPQALYGWLVEVPRGFAGLDPLLKAAGGPNHAGAPRRLQIQGAQPGEKFVFIFNH